LQLLFEDHWDALYNERYFNFTTRLSVLVVLGWAYTLAACCPLVIHVEYVPRALKTGQTSVLSRHPRFGEIESIEGKCWGLGLCPSAFQGHSLWSGGLGTKPPPEEPPKAGRFLLQK